jgi:hypothetical protein
MFNYIIKPILLDDIVEYDKQKYNSNNHWENNTRPDDYEFILSQTSTSKWIDKFKNYNKITIDNPVWIQWLKEAAEISSKTGKFTKLFSDEFDVIVRELDNKFGYLFQNIKPGYFVRVNNVSLKYGQHKEGPYSNIRNILESIVSSIGSHSPIKPNTSSLDIYLIEWVEIKPEFEFRVFVFNNKITAISQQNLYSKLFTNYLSVPDNFINIIKEKLDIVINYFYLNMQNKITWISNYTFDFAIIDSKPFFIELNSFGKEYAAGSALFHWELDEKILYNDFSDENLTIEFRYTV